MAQALKKFGIKDFAKNEYLCPHFLEYQLFQIKKYLRTTFGQFHFLSNIWVKLIIYKVKEEIL